MLGVNVPPGGVFHGFRGNLRIHGAETVIANALLYGLDAYAVTLHDVDAGDTFDTVWDLQVPKTSEDVDTMDLDVETTDTDPVFEPGEHSWEKLFGWEGGIDKLLQYRRIFTAADFIGGLAATGGFTHYMPGEVKPITIRHGKIVDQATVIMMALSSPVMDRTTAGALTILSEGNFLKLQLLRDTAVDAIHQLMGAVEAGAETPYVEAAAFLDLLLSPPPTEEVAGEFGTTTWQCTLSGKVTVSVPGTINVGRLDGEVW